MVNGWWIHGEWRIFMANYNGYWKIILIIGKPNNFPAPIEVKHDIGNKYPLM